MSRRHVSVREPRPADHQGWLQRQTGTQGILGSRWRRNWFVLKSGALYWYPSHKAEEAEGFLDLTDFTVQPIRSHWKRQVLQLSLRGLNMVVMAAESITEMSLWLDKLCAAILQTKAVHHSNNRVCPVPDCYRRVRERESDESVFYSCPHYTELPTVDSVIGNFPPPCFTSSPFFRHVLHSRHARRTSRRTSRTSTASTSRTSSSENSEAGSFLDLAAPDTEVGALRVPTPSHLTVKRRPDDTATSSSLLRLRETVYLVRILNPTLKTEEAADLLALEQALADPGRPADLKFCNWSRKFILLREIGRRTRPAGGARERWIPAAEEHRVAETSV
ncbi:hypothetical protein NHX12_026096 [Muraenolepis orangiensis]|uniref:PH domain-containing protein n=1 Tax=Muraenolepis orangiensis TaxID=630683 RepID=A0A9Q0EJQ3_9TELE|nr:hypothetical protein NHX12_026096 [Muraenolepis orangiensis]